MAARRARDHRRQRGRRAARRDRARHRRRGLRSRVHRPRLAVLGSVCPRHHRRASPAVRTRPSGRAPRSRRWRGRPPMSSTRWPRPPAHLRRSCGSTAAPAPWTCCASSRPTCSGSPCADRSFTETTALGAATLAGIAEGVWETPADGHRTRHRRLGPSCPTASRTRPAPRRVASGRRAGTGLGAGTADPADRSYDRRDERRPTATSSSRRASTSATSAATRPPTDASVRWNTLYRSDTLHRLTDDDADDLRGARPAHGRSTSAPPSSSTTTAASRSRRATACWHHVPMLDNVKLAPRDPSDPPAACLTDPDNDARRALRRHRRALRRVGGDSVRAAHPPRRVPRGLPLHLGEGPHRRDRGDDPRPPRRAGRRDRGRLRAHRSGTRPQHARGSRPTNPSSQPSSPRYRPNGGSCAPTPSSASSKASAPATARSQSSSNRGHHPTPTDTLRKALIEP